MWYFIWIVGITLTIVVTIMSVLKSERAAEKHIGKK
ncbi:MAG: cytochrome bd oxidase small subunit, CydX/CbdX family [Neisseriales bacterium]|nr:MAG: cytochrome bd oxidase small subunit, CydX/CbdX family [Neisseriales bacterium]